MRRALLYALAFLPGTALAEADVRLCDWEASAENIPEPWGHHTRTFANGHTRLTLLDTGQPGEAAYYLLVLTGPRDADGLRKCQLVGHRDYGFAAFDFAGLTAEYSPAIGLTVSTDVAVYSQATNEVLPGRLSVTLNQSTGAIVARIDGVLIP